MRANGTFSLLEMRLNEYADIPDASTPQLACAAVVRRHSLLTSPIKIVQHTCSETAPVLASTRLPMRHACDSQLQMASGI